MTELEMMDPTVQKIRALMARKDWGKHETAAYLGVPVTTFANWLSGAKKPSAAVVRLVDVLGMVEAFAPMVHANLIPAGKANGTQTD